MYKHRNLMTIYYMILGMLMLNAATAKAHMPINFNTLRCRAEKVTKNHTDYLSQLFSDKHVQEAYNTGDVATFTNIPAQLALIGDQWDKHGYGLYVVFDRTTSNFMGVAGFHSVLIDENNAVQIMTKIDSQCAELYGLLMPNYWRKGYGVEIATELINLASKYLPHTEIVSYVEPKNEAAINLSKKLNFIEQGLVTYNNKIHILFRLNVNS